MLPPEIMVTIRQTGSQPDGSAPYLAVTARSSGDEICSNSFDFQPDLLIDIEPQWMLERAVPRYNGETIKRGPADGERLDEQEAKLAAYGQRLYGFLFGDGGKLKAFLEFNDSYRRQARLTLALHGNASALWRLPWEYLHDGDDFLVLHGRFLLSRVPYGLAEMQPPSAPLPLRILVVIAAPDDQKPLDTEEEIGVIQTPPCPPLLRHCAASSLVCCTTPATANTTKRPNGASWPWKTTAGRPKMQVSKNCALT
jgi:hypothetical protein